MPRIVSEGALVRRINRKLKDDSEWLRKARGHRKQCAVGEYYVLDVPSNVVIFSDVNLEELGREVGALKENEKLAHLN